MNPLDLLGKIIIDTRSVEQTIDTLGRMERVIDSVGDLTDEQSRKIQKSLDNQSDSFGNLADKVKEANDVSESHLRKQQLIENAIAKATNTTGNYIANVKKAAIADEEKTQLIGEAIGALKGYKDMLQKSDATSLEFATAGVQLSNTIGQLSRDLKTAASSLGENEQKSVATIRSLGQLDSVYTRTNAAIKTSALTTEQKALEQAKLNDMYRQAQSALNTYGTGNAKAAKAQVEFRQQVALARTELDRVNQAAKARQLEDWRNQMTNLTKSVQLALGPLSGIASRITALSGLFNRNGAALAGLFASLTAFTVLLAQSAKAGVETERQLAGLQSRIEVLGLASETSAKQFNEMAHRLANATLSNASDIREAQGALLEFGNIGVDSFERVIKAAIGMQSTFGGGLNEQIAKLGRLLDDPIKNFDALARRGITFNQMEKEKITLLQQSGDLFKAQQSVLEKFAGFEAKATAETKSLAGALDTVSGNMDLLREKLFIGSGASEVATQRVSEFAKAIQDFSNSGAAKVLGEAFVVAVRVAGDSILYLRKNIDVITPILVALSTFMATKAAIGALVWATRLSGVATVVRVLPALLMAKKAAIEASTVATERNTAANYRNRLSMLGLAGGLISLGVSMYSMIQARKLLNNLSDANTFDPSKVTEYQTKMSETSDATAQLIEQEKLLQQRRETDQSIEKMKKELDEYNIKVKEATKLVQENSPSSPSSTPSQVWRDALDSLREYNKKARDTRATLQELEKTSATLNEQFKAGEQVMISQQAALNKFDYKNSAVFIDTMASALDNESKAIRKATTDLETLNKLRENATKALLTGTDAEKEAARNQLAEMERLIPLQEQHLDYLNRTTVAARQLNAEENLRSKFSENMQNLNAEMLAYQLHSGNAVKLNEALFSIKIRKDAESIRKEIEGIANTSKDSTKFYQDLADVMGNDVKPNAESIANAMAHQNAQRDIALERESQMQKYNQMKIDMMPVMDGITERYRLQAEAAKVLGGVEEENFIKWLAIQQKKEETQARIDQAKLEAGLKSGFGTDTERQQLELIQLEETMNQKLELARSFYGEDSALLEQHTAKIKSQYEKQQAIMVAGHRMDDALKVTGQGMSMMEALNKKSGTAYKAFAIADASIKAAQAAMGALATGGPILGPILAAMIAVQTGAQIRQIKSQKFSTGGYVSGSGTGTSDSIPAMLSNGEYVIKQSAVQRLGINNLDMINQGKMPTFNMGGVVGVAASNQTNTNQNNTIVQVIDQRSSGGVIEQEESVDENGQRMLKLFVRDAVNEAIRSGSLDQTMASTFGLNRQAVRR